MPTENKNSFMSDWLRSLAVDFPGFTRHDAELALSVLTVNELHIVASSLRKRALADGAIRADFSSRGIVVREYDVPDSAYGPVPLREACLLYADLIVRRAVRPPAILGAESSGYNVLVNCVASQVDLSMRRRASGALTPPAGARPYMS